MARSNYSQENILKKARINQMSTQKINGLASEEFLSKISTKFAKKILEKLKQLECESIDIKKLLNNVDFRKRIQHSLRTNEDQIISGETKIDRLKLKVQAIFQGPVKIFGTKQEIFQDVKFGQELLEVNQLLVMERINNVLFVGGVAQVLRKMIMRLS
jgi:energy-coupling factor transporter ATP-binding protein EcfA2